MSEELKTIKELADELGVNKQNVQYHIKSLPNKERLKNEKGIILLTIDEQNFIRAKILKISTDKVLTDKVLADKVLADKVLTDKVLADKVLADKVLTDKVLADKVF
ncbi:replication-associated protein RepX [Lactococcus petauri]|uniref:replication-associated protein RepX n=1 Tax=Lactococcus petauri TaxID=1940789 RepID=UPI002891E714|nr:replication-associated protein RepX [Lactococcus petauri]MDT2595365.1 replication-associated protein RepX [Lactococcus petauri]